MMREFDLDDNDPLSQYLKTIMKVEAPSALLPKNASQTAVPTRDNKDDSISDIARRRSGNINHVVTDAENDKLSETERVSKQMDYGNDLFAALILCCQEIILVWKGGWSKRESEHESVENISGKLFGSFSFVSCESGDD